MATSQKTQSARKGNRPVHEIRIGRIKVAFWANETESGVRYSAKFSRLYKDEEGWKDADHFGPDDMLLVAKIADWAHTWMIEQRASGGSSEETHF